MLAHPKPLITIKPLRSGKYIRPGSDFARMTLFAMVSVSP
ncbi:hypothetical protein TRICHSKD4_5803 [Roseibium sp. TrichSKD4]|nr:hypothetical protein TRICHSKD4_5803 [Roseibium sp. TrichSKD4]